MPNFLAISAYCFEKSVQTSRPIFYLNGSFVGFVVLLYFLYLVLYIFWISYMSDVWLAECLLVYAGCLCRKEFLFTPLSLWLCLAFWYYEVLLVSCWPYSWANGILFRKSFSTPVSCWILPVFLLAALVFQVSGLGL